MSVRLVSLNPAAAPTLNLQRPVLLIGRHPECDARLDLPQVSRRHCCLAQAYDRLLIRDLGSRNGVRVNGRTVDEALLRDGDEVAIAQLIFRLEDTTRPAAPTPSAVDEADLLPDLPLDSDDPDDDLVPLSDIFPRL